MHGQSFKIFLAVGAVSLSLAAVATADPAAGMEPREISIATGSISGNYYPVGGSVCRLVNRTRPAHGISCRVDVTSGSVANLNLLLGGFNDFAIVQSDVLAKIDTLTLEKDLAHRPDTLRAVMRLYSETLTVVVRDDGSGAATLDALKGRRVAAGAAASGHAASFALLRKAAGWSQADSRGLTNLSIDRQADALCHGTIDGFVNVIGHPNPAVARALDLCVIRMVPLPDGLIRNMAGLGVGYRAATLPAGLYGNFPPSPVRSIATAAVLVAREDVAADIVQALVAAVRSNFTEWRRMHPVLERLDARALEPVRMPVPPHDSAKAAFGAASP